MILQNRDDAHNLQRIQRPTVRLWLNTYTSISQPSCKPDAVAIIYGVETSILM